MKWFGLSSSSLINIRDYLLVPSFFLLLVIQVQIVTVNSQTGGYAENLNYYGGEGNAYNNYPTEYYNENSDFPLYEFPPVTSYANGLNSGSGNNGIIGGNNGKNVDAKKLKQAQEAAEQRDYEYYYLDNANNQNDSYYLNEQTTLKNNYPLSSKKDDKNTKNLEEKLPYKIPKFQALPFEHEVKDFERHPYEGADNGIHIHDKDFRITKFGNYGEFTKEIVLVTVLFLGLYVVFAVLLQDGEKLLQRKCEQWGWDGFPEYEFHAIARVVPAVPTDEQIQKEILELFHGGYRTHGNEDSSSSEEDSMESTYGHELSYISEMCSPDAFFFSMAPRHVLAYTAIHRMLVAQETPKDVLQLAKNLLHSKKVNPKAWYYGLLGSALERPDMNGFAIAHPLDAFPDRFIPAHLIDQDSDEWRRRSSLPVERTMEIKFNYKDIHSNVTSEFKGNSTYTIKSKWQNTKKDKKKSRITREVAKNVETKNNLNQTATEIFSEISAKNLNSTGNGNVSEITDEKERLGLGRTPPYKIYPKKQKGGTKKVKHSKVNNNNNKGSENEHEHNKKQKSKEKGKHKKKECIIVDGSVGKDNGIENKLWYWREDLMLNQHHFYWHQIYPTNATRHGDRRAELFLSMHRALIARYNAERLSNGLERTRIMELYYGAVMEEPYDSHLADINSGQFWTPRKPFSSLVDTIHEQDPDFALNIIIQEFLGLYGRFKKAIRTGKLLTIKGGYLPIKSKKGHGVEPLGNTLEASELSVNPMHYDPFGFHNAGHYLVALMTDPDYHKKLPSGIMADVSVSMRDPAFYRYHEIIDEIFESYKETLPPYQITGGVYPLLWNGVEIIDVEIKSQHRVNEIKTFFSQQKFPLASGIDGSIKKGQKVDICATHLDHEPFQFKIVIDRKPCAKSNSGIATVRLLMAPRFDEHGVRLPLYQQRRLMFPLDTFQADLKIGRNTITRRDIDSSLTIAWTKSLKQMENEPNYNGQAEDCGCGWPRHLYIPKGSLEGMAFDLFVMVTNYDHDFVADDPADLEIPETCNSPYIFCGHQRRRYPDSKPMGYPFDRPIYKYCSGILCKFLPDSGRPVHTLEEYVAPVPNMATITFGIKHIDELIHKSENSDEER